MSIINRPPEMVKREYELQEPIAVAVEKYATFIQSTPGSRRQLRTEDRDLERCGVPPLAQTTANTSRQEGCPCCAKGGAGMIQRILHARRLLACLLSAATGMALYFRAPFPEDNIFLRVMAIRSAP